LIRFGICGSDGMTNENPVRFTLSDTTHVVVKKVLNNKYDFELTLPNGNRKTFIWLENNENEFIDRKGISDKLITEAVTMFVRMMNA
jgi:hypothetical protein